MKGINMKKTLSLVAVVGLLVAQECLAFMVNVDRNVGYYTLPGGEFTVTAANPPEPQFDAILKNYAAAATLNGGFETFCLSETTALQNNPQDASLTPNGVTKGTAYLYQLFGEGALGGYDYAGVGAGREASAFALQNVIWTLQGFVPYDTSGMYATWLSAAETYAGGTLADAQAPNNGQLPVDQLLLTYTPVTGGQVVSQPMLALVPDGGTTLMLLGMALGSFSVVARRFRR
jgi:hypothetical protein